MSRRTEGQTQSGNGIESVNRVRIGGVLVLLIHGAIVVLGVLVIMYPLEQIDSFISISSIHSIRIHNLCFLACGDKR